MNEVPCTCLRGIELRPIGPETIDALFDMLCGAHETARRWRFRGAAMERNEFERRLGDGVYAHYVAVRQRSDEIVSYVGAYDANLRDGYCYVGMAVQDRLRQRTGVGTIAMFLLLDTLFVGGPFRKVYAEAAEANLEQYGSAVGKLCEIEGCMKEHEWRDGHYSDVYLLSLWRDRWMAMRASYGLGAR
jgi:RimJ/RimL family protein N-acetyltransferase